MIYDDIIIENSLNNLIKDQGDIIKEQYQNQIDILNTIIKFQSCDDLSIIKEEFKETIKNKIKEIIKKFIEWCKQLKTKIDLFMAKYMKNFNIKEKKYIALYKKEIEPIIRDKELPDNDKFLKIANILKNNNFAVIKDKNDEMDEGYLLHHYKLHSMKDFINDTIEDNIKSINKKIIQYQGEIIKELHKLDINNGFKVKKYIINLEVSMETLDKKIEDIISNKEKSILPVFSIYNLNPENIIPYDEIKTFENMLKTYNITTKEIVSTTDEFLGKLENELQKNDNDLDIKELNSLITSINSYKTNIINEYTKYLIYVSKNIYKEMGFIINREIYENMKNN